MSRIWCFCITIAFFNHGCARNKNDASSTARSPITTTGQPVTNTAPLTTPTPIQCTGRRVGTYAWDQSYWRRGNTELLDFLDSNTGRQWACGDLSINVADYSNADEIHNSDMLIAFIQEYRLRFRDMTPVVWITYGDVVEKSGAAMLLFTRTFFRWASAIPSDVAKSMGTIGISYDVEHFDPEETKAALLLARQLREGTNFPNGAILIQHTIEGAPNVVGTDYVMKYADSALAMVYRNYMRDPTGKYQEDSNLLNRLMWMLTEQCPKCLDDGYAISNYKAKITVMVEAACRMGASCGKVSFCAFDGSDEGANYMVTILDELDSKLLASNELTQNQLDRLFSSSTPYSVHNWEWYRCYAPFSSNFNYESCSTYHQYAATCRDE